jgi:transcriptional regulator with XRE-family HTH domain
LQRGFGPVFFKNYIMTEKEIAYNRIRIGQRIAHLREEKGLTQQQVADATGIIRSNIARVEAGKRNVSIDLLARIGAALGCSIDFMPE